MILDILAAVSRGIGLTLYVTGASLLFGGLLGLLLAAGARSPIAPLRAVVTGYINIVRVIPPLTWLFLIYFGLPQYSLKLTTLQAAILGFSMLTPSLSSLLSRRTPQALQGEVLGIGQSMLALARALGPAIGMPLMGLQHPSPKETTLLHPSWPYWFGAAAMFVALIGGIRLRSAKVPERTDAAAV